MGSTAANTAGAQPIPGAGESSWRGCPALHRYRAARLLRPGTFHAAGCTPLRTGTPCASGDRFPVPDGVERPRPHRNVPDDFDCHLG